MGFKARPLLASLFFVLLPLAVLAAPTERRHGGHHGEEGAHEHKHGFAIKAHGTLLTLAFSFLYPTGVFLIRGGFQKGFVLHWGTQAGATTAALVGMLFMIIKSWSRLIVSLLVRFSGLHLPVKLDQLLYYSNADHRLLPERKSGCSSLHRHRALFCNLLASAIGLLPSRPLRQSAPANRH